jgi:GTP-binding protein
MIDTALIHVKAGDGGHGKLSFLRRKFQPKGGPNGGDGARGGSVYLVGDKDMNTLQDFMGKRKFEAEPGGEGGEELMHGANGSDLDIAVPVGTVISVVNEVSGEKTIVAEILKDGQRLRIAKGGRGGYGNTHYKSSINQTPMYYQKGTLGERFELFLELKLLANVGFVGLPNAGKSSLLAMLTKARPQIANYPFTTLSPNLGVMVDEKTGKSIVLADIPGLIEGAGEGKGLGHEFLRHIERCSVLLMVLALDEAVVYDADRSNVEKAKTLVDTRALLEKELASFHPDLLKKKMLIGVNKADLYSEELRSAIKKVLPESIVFSAMTHEGIDAIKELLVLHGAVSENTI